MSKIGNQKAFPSYDGGDVYFDGMTYRQWLVGMALQGLLAGVPDKRPSDIARWAREHADAVLSELEKHP